MSIHVCMPIHMSINMPMHFSMHRYVSGGEVCEDGSIATPTQDLPSVDPLQVVDSVRNAN